MSKVGIIIILTLLGLLGFSLIVIWTGVDTIISIVAKAGFICIICYIVNAAVYLIITATSWHILMRSDGVKISLLDSIRANFMGFAINFLTPSMYLGSEPFRALFVSKKTNESMRRILAITIVGKFQEISSLVLFMIISSAVIVYTTGLLPKNIETALVITVITMTIAMIVLASLYIFNLKPISNFFILLWKLGLPARVVLKWRSKIDDLEQTIHMSFTKRVKPFLIAQFLTLISTFTLFARPFIIFYFANETRPLELHHICAVYLITNLINLLQFIPGSLGLFEGGLVLYFVHSGLGAQNSMAFSIVNRISDLALVALSVWLIVHFGLSQLAKSKILGGT